MAVEVEGLRERIASAESLHSIVQTMRTLAAVNIRRAQQATVAAGEYLRSVHLALYVALREYRDVPPERTASGESIPTLLVLSSNQGLCGSFNERITQHALNLGAKIATKLGVDRSEIPYACVGYRGADRLATAGAKVVSVLDAPTSVEGVGPLVREIYSRVAERISPGTKLMGVFNKTTSGSGFVESEVQLLPFDAGRWRELPEGETPFSTIPVVSGRSTEAILPDLMRELLYIDLFRILVESFAAENAARLLSMQGATENIEGLLDELNAAYREARQDAITNELMDILGGILAAES